MKYIIDLKTGIEKLIIENNAYFIGEDIQDPYGGAFKVTRGLSSRYPNNIIGTPMCEQGFTGLGLGMALYGYYVSVEIMFADFITLSADQMINHAAKFRELYNQEIHFVLRSSAGAYRGYGATHSQSLEKIYLGIPGINVVAASIAYSPGKLLEQAINSGVPTLFIENKLDYSRDLLEESSVVWKKEVISGMNGFPLVKLMPIEGDVDFIIITYGGLVEFAVKAMEQLLYEDEINVGIIIPSLLSDISTILDNTVSVPICIVEEGVEDFGWGAEIECGMLKKYKNAVYRLGAKNSFIPSAKEAELEVLPSLETLVHMIKEACADEL